LDINEIWEDWEEEEGEPSDLDEIIAMVDGI